jgi:hypothetical protein
MSEVKSTYEIKFPSETTYFIAYTNTDIFAYGIVTPEQEMTTGQPILWTTLSEAEWIYKLETEFNTNPFPPEPDDL